MQFAGNDQSTACSRRSFFRKWARHLFVLNCNQSQWTSTLKLQFWLAKNSFIKFLVAVESGERRNKKVGVKIENLIAVDSVWLRSKEILTSIKSLSESGSFTFRCLSNCAFWARQTKAVIQFLDKESKVISMRNVEITISKLQKKWMLHKFFFLYFGFSAICDDSFPPSHSPFPCFFSARNV